DPNTRMKAEEVVAMPEVKRTMQKR
ncbi:MAG: hypothetical protein EZS28_050390, partial [Streblomastix strix]